MACRLCRHSRKQCQCRCKKCCTPVAECAVSYDDVLAALCSRKVVRSGRQWNENDVDEWIFKLGGAGSFERCRCVPPDKPQWRRRTENGQWSDWQDLKGLQQNGLMRYLRTTEIGIISLGDDELDNMLSSSGGVTDGSLAGDSLGSARQPSVPPPPPRVDLPAGGPRPYPRREGGGWEDGGGSQSVHSGQTATLQLPARPPSAGDASQGGVRAAEMQATHALNNLRELFRQVPKVENLVRMYLERTSAYFQGQDPLSWRAGLFAIEGTTTQERCLRALGCLIGKQLGAEKRTPTSAPEVLECIVEAIYPCCVIDFWRIYCEELQSKDAPPEEYVQKLEEYLNTAMIGIDTSAVVPAESFGVFFRMLSFVADFVLFVIEHDAGVQGQLLRLGFRSFAPLNLDVGVGETMPLGTALLQGKADGEEMGTGEQASQGACRYICGYNVGECPAWVPEGGISLSGGGVTPKHLELVAKMSAEFHQRSAEPDTTEEDEEDEEAVSAASAFPGAANPFAQAERAADPPAPAPAPVGEEEGRAAIRGAVEALTLRRRLAACLDGSEALSPALLALITPCQDAANVLHPSSTRTRGSTRGRGLQSTTGEMIERFLAEMHDFGGEDGVCTSDWVLQVWSCPALDPARGCCFRLLWADSRPSPLGWLSIMSPTRARWHDALSPYPLSACPISIPSTLPQRIQLPSSDIALARTHAHTHTHTHR